MSATFHNAFAQLADCENKLALLRAAKSVCSGMAAICAGEERDEIIALSHMVMASTSDEIRIRQARADIYELMGESRLLRFRGKEEDASTRDKFWKWPIRVIESGWACGSVEGNQRDAQYFPPEIMPQIARAAEGKRFRRRHPTPLERERADLEMQLVAGWISDARVEKSPSGTAVHANANLFRNQHLLRAQLMAARDDRRLDLFGISISGVFKWRRSKIQGRPAFVCSSLANLLGVDLTVGTPAGAGGKFLA